MSRDIEYELLQKYVDGSLTAAELDRLNSRLRNDVQARSQFVELLNLDSALAALAESSEVALEGPLCASDAVEARPPSNRTKLNARRSMLVAACGIFCMVGVLWWWQAASQPWARVQNRVGEGAPLAGAALRGETYELQEGIVQFVTLQGAEIVIEAPAAFQFQSAGRLKLTRGRLSADVPPSAKGFTVVTPSGEAVDLGTRFGVDVPDDGPSEIHVFQGEVIAKASGANASNNLYEGDAVSLDRGASVSRELRSAAFIESAEMSELTAGFASGQQQRAERAKTQLRNDSDLIVLLDFESTEEDRTDKRQGVYRVSQGRWPGSRAPEFVNVGDHLQLDVGGDREWPQLTLAAWVRLDRLGEPYQSLLHTNGWGSDNPGQVHWMVTRHSTMRLALYGNTLAAGAEEREMYPDSRTSVLPERGRWVHLATVYDSEARTVRFYLNGQFDKQTRQAIAHPAKLGPAQIGNWNQRDRKLSGRIDEIVLLGRAVSDDEIAAMFQAGNPYRRSAE